MQVASQEMKKAYLPVLPSGDFTKSQLRVRAITDKGEFITSYCCKSDIEKVPGRQLLYIQLEKNYYRYYCRN